MGVAANTGATLNGTGNFDLTTSSATTTSAVTPVLRGRLPADVPIMSSCALEDPGSYGLSACASKTIMKNDYGNCNSLETEIPSKMGGIRYIKSARARRAGFGKEIEDYGRCQDPTGLRKLNRLDFNGLAHCFSNTELFCDYGGARRAEKNEGNVGYL